MGNDVRILSKEQFIESKESWKYSSYEDYCYAQSKVLKQTSIHTLANKKTPSADMGQMMREQEIARLEKKNAISEALINKYKSLEQVYQQMKSQSSATIGQMMNNYGVKSQNELMTTFRDKNVLFDSSKYSQSVKSKDEAYQAFCAALSTANSFTHQI